MAEKTVRICVGKGYDVRIGSGLLPRCGKYVKAVIGTCRAAVVTDSTVAGLYLDKVRQSMSGAGFEVESYIFPAGEGSKSITTLSGILESLAERHFTRSDVVIALGGGVTGDMAGFAAAVYFRGIRFRADAPLRCLPPWILPSEAKLRSTSRLVKILLEHSSSRSWSFAIQTA